jgi:negative regulator of flagellin synthesis FlgM
MDSQSPPESKPSEDRVEISAKAQSEEPGEESDARALRLAQIKAAIEAGEYETQDKLDAALSRLFEEIGLHDDEESPD